MEQAGVTITAAQGIVRFDPARLRLVGLAPEAPVPVVGLGGIAAGELRWVNVRVGGLPRRAAVFVFEVRSAGWTSGLTLELQEANDPQGEPLPAASIFPLREPGDLVVPANPVSPP